MNWKRRVLVVIVTGVMALASLGLGYLVRSYAPRSGAPMVFAQTAQHSQPFAAEAQAIVVGGKEVGVLTVDNKEVLRIHAALGGLTPFERVNTLAKRMRRAVAQGVKPKDIHTSSVRGETVVMASHTILITVGREDARQAEMASRSLGRTWATNLSNSVAAYYARAGQSGSAVASTKWTPEEPYEDRWVPILSLLRGVRVGAARVSGPTSRVDLVQAVAQIETNWKNYVEIEMYVPVSTKVPGSKLDRVKGCSVTGIGDFKL